MGNKILFQRSKKYQAELKFLDKKDLAIFVKQQFFQLMKKNLRVPVKLYQL